LRILDVGGSASRFCIDLRQNVGWRNVSSPVPGDSYIPQSSSPACPRCYNEPTVPSPALPWRQSLEQPDPFDPVTEHERNSNGAYSALRPCFPDWEGVHRARLLPLISAIRSGGLFNRKVVRIKVLLAEIWLGQMMGKTEPCDSSPTRRPPYVRGGGARGTHVGLVQAHGNSRKLGRKTVAIRLLRA